MDDLHQPMNFRVNCALRYTLRDPATFLFSIQCMEMGAQRILTESLRFTPSLAAKEFRISGNETRFSRITTLDEGILEVSYDADVRISPELVPIATIASNQLEDLPPEVIPLLFPSRYCQSDRLRQTAHEMFGHLTESHEITLAIRDWIASNINYVSGSSGENCSAVDTLARREGVCRDFAHLGIAFCRALNVPARYATFYAHQLDPQDFHACFEAFIGGAWYTFDPTGLAPLNGLIRIATGRDAADAAVCTIFGNPELTLSWVTCTCLDADFFPITQADLTERRAAITLA